MTIETWDFSGVSSNVGACVYDSEQRTLQVTFQSGHSYEGQGVPSSVWEAFCSDQSAGAYFRRHLRGRYGFPP